MLRRRKSARLSLARGVGAAERIQEEQVPRDAAESSQAEKTPGQWRQSLSELGCSRAALVGAAGLRQTGTPRAPGEAGVPAQHCWAPSFGPERGRQCTTAEMWRARMFFSWTQTLGISER